jgi:hypothetical protein
MVSEKANPDQALLSGTSAPDVVSARADRLSYAADLLAELHRLIAADAGTETLQGLLVLAQVEARRQGRQRS